MMKKKQRKGFFSKIKEKWFQNNIIAIFIAIILISGLSIGYASFYEALNISGMVNLRANEDIRISKIINTHASCGLDIYDPQYTEDTIIINGKLPGLNCILEYTVSVKNTTAFVMELKGIDDEVYNNTDIVYETDMTVGMIIPANSTEEYTLTFKYKSSLSTLPINTEIGAILVFDFGLADIVTYDLPFVSNGLVLLYDANNNIGQGYSSKSNTWKDLIGNNDGTLMGNPTWHDGYLEFDGVDDKVKFTGNLPPVYTITITFEPDFTNPASWARLYSESPFPSLYINTDSGVRTLRLYGHGIDSIFPNSTLSEQKTQATLVFNGSTLVLYINGLYVSTLSSKATPKSVINAYLGGRELDNLRQFKGKIYNFMIYDRALTLIDVMNNYSAIVTDAVIPITTSAQLLKIGTGEVVDIGGVNYLFAPDASYRVKQNLSLSYNGLWNPNIVAPGSIITYDKVITITNTNDNSIHYYQNELYVTEDNAIKDGLVLHYDSINNTGSGHSNSTLTWKDLKGNNDATLQNGVTWNGDKLSFDGIDDKVRFAGTLPNTYSMIITIKPVLTGNYPRLFGENPFPTIYLHSAQSYRIGLYSHGKDQAFNPYRTPTTFVPTYIVITCNSSKVVLYVNGDEISSIDIAANATAMQYAYLGGRAANDRQYTGDIYDFMIYDRILTDFEIERSYITNSYKY